MKQRPREATRRQRKATLAAYVLPPQRPERLREAGSKSRREGDRSQPAHYTTNFRFGSPSPTVLRCIEAQTILPDLSGSATNQANGLGSTPQISLQDRFYEHGLM